MRQIVLDTETTGLEPRDGHRIIEIGAVEMFDRRLTGRHFHEYINPDRRIDAGAIEVHGITNEFLQDKPRFDAIVDGFLEFIRDSELIIHNAPFDVGFLDHEFGLLGNNTGRVADYASVLDSLDLARQMHPGMRNSLDALCKRYEVDNSNRSLHGALLDSELLAEVYLRMTGGQTALSLDMERSGEVESAQFDLGERPPLVVRTADEHELSKHEARLDQIEETAGKVIWRTL